MLRQRDRQGGFILISVLWVVLLMASLSALFVRTVLADARSGSAYVRNAVAEAAADGAIRLIAFRLAGETQFEQRQAIPANGSPWRCHLFGDVAATISVQDQDGLIDLNRAPMSLLEPALRGLLSPETAEIALSEVARRRELGVEGSQLDPARRGEVDSAAPDELVGSLDLDPGEDDRAIQFFTTYSRSDGLDPASAPSELVALLGRGARGGSGTASSAGLPHSFVRQSRMRIFSITAEVGDGVRGRSVRRAVVELVRSPELLFRVLEWGIAGGRGAQTSGGLGKLAAEKGLVPCLPASS